MKLENQISNLELSKRLKESGVKQESLWRWVEFINRGKTIGDKIRYKQIIRTLEMEDMAKMEHITILNKCSAFTTSELGEMLPQYIGDRDYMLTCVKNDNATWWCGYANHKLKAKNAQQADTEANARAKMVIYLKEKGLK